MVRNYLVIALRNFQRQKFFALLNMFGLALGLTSAILIFLYVSDELQYDQMHPDWKNTYRAGVRFINRDGQVFDNTVLAGYPTWRLKETRSEVVNNILIDYIGYPTSLHNKSTDRIILTEEIKWAEPGFESVLYFDLIKGNPQKFFENHNSIVLSETGAHRLFGDQDPIGELVTVKHPFGTNGKEIECAVTGVYRDLPANSSFKPKYIINLNAFRSVLDNYDQYVQGSTFNNLEFFENYLVLKPGADIAALEKELKLHTDHMIASDSSARAQGFKLEPFLAKMSDLHFDEKNLWENDSTRGDKKYLAIFSTVAISILLIACINYMNLATARSARRAREVGLRKSLGSLRSEIASQFLYESSLTTFGALLLAVAMSIVLLTPFNQLAHKAFTPLSLFNPLLIGIVAAVIILTALISGSYPALYLSGFHPADVLKGQVVKGRGAELFRKSLVTLQFVVALVLIISTFIIIRQMTYVQESKLNEMGDQLLSIRYGGTAPKNKFQAFKQAVLEDPEIRHVTMANHLPRLNYFGFIGAQVKFPDFENKDLQWNQLNVEFDFPKTYNLEFVVGRDFEHTPADSSNVILNEAAIAALHQPIEKVIGSTLSEQYFDFATRSTATRNFKVIGVVKDFPYRSMHQAIEPLMLNPHLSFIDCIAYIRLPHGKFQEKIAAIEKKWKQVLPGVGFDYWFVSDEFKRMYQSERQISSLSKAFAGLAILITAMGVFGLASYTAEQKTKEVGIRKVMGASERQVIALFAGLFIKIFVVASAIGIPLAWWITDWWLKDFAYRAPVSIFIFAASASTLLLLTLLTVGYETFKAARANPVNSLRVE